GAHQVTLHHVSGFHHVPLDLAPWEYLSFEQKGEYDVWTVLCFDWCSSPYAYHTLSEVATQNLRCRGVPLLASIGGFWLTSSRSTKSYPPNTYCCGYSMSNPKCTLEPTTKIVFLGILCDMENCRFEIPE
ncbi:unnamed protein product, partial [Sphacelaria rigidula]